MSSIPAVAHNGLIRDAHPTVLPPNNTTGRQTRFGAIFGDLKNESKAEDASPTSSPQPSLTPSSRPISLGFDHHIHVVQCETEIALLTSFLKFVRVLDPDVILGYEIQKGSWGYIIDRANALARTTSTYIHLPNSMPVNTPLNNNSKVTPPSFLDELGRVRAVPQEKRSNPVVDQYGQRHASGLNITGRVALNLWRILRHEVKLGIYTFENVAFHVLRRRMPHYPPHVLTLWFMATLVTHHQQMHGTGDNESLSPHHYNGESKGEVKEPNDSKRNDQPTAPPQHGGEGQSSSSSAHHQDPTGSGMWRVLQYILDRSRADMEILDTLDFIGRCSEMARVFGIKFFDVLYRGSQYRVESMLLRLAKPQNYVMISLSHEQVAAQPGMECLPLVRNYTCNLFCDFLTFD
jgi:DNA polymerase elongation subunit (family B)